MTNQKDHGWFPEASSRDIEEARARDLRRARRKPKPRKDPKKWNWPTHAEKEAVRVAQETSEEVKEVEYLARILGVKVAWLKKQPDATSDCSSEEEHFSALLLTGECPYCLQQEVPSYE